MSNEKETLKALFDEGVLTESEYEGLIKTTDNTKNDNDLAKNRPTVTEYDHLKDLVDLRREGIINDNEFVKKLNQTLGIQVSNPVENETKATPGFIKRNLVFLLVIATLIIALEVYDSLLSTL